jgi:uncharacterized protein
MKWKPIWWVVGGLLALAAGGARAAEERIEVAPGVGAAWLVPEGTWDGRAVVLLHGFADDMDGPADLCRHLAEALTARGIATLRINFRGEGDKRRTDIESTRGSRLEDAAAAYAWLQARAGVDVKRVGVLGFSLGGGTAIETAGVHPEWFRSLALWSSVGGDFYAAMTAGEMGALAREAAAKGQGSLEIKGWKTVTVRDAFFESFRGVDLDALLARYPGAFLSVRGSEDHLPAHEAAFLRAASGEPREALLIGGADHIFRVFEPEKGYATRATAATVAWFERTL